MIDNSKIKCKVISECGVLEEVLLAPAHTFVLSDPINNTQKHFYKASPPRPELVVEQHSAFAKALESARVKVTLSSPNAACPFQINVRDVGTVIDETFVVCALKEPIRQKEPETLSQVLNRTAAKSVRVEGGVVEGGDIQLAQDRMFVGISERTNETGLKWISKHFAEDFNIVPIVLRPEFLHLDVVFNIVRPELALIYSPAIAPDSLKIIAKSFELIEVTAKEQFELTCNTLSISPQRLIADKSSRRINSLLNQKGTEIIELDFSDIRKLGGSFRCATCPLRRGAV